MLLEFPVLPVKLLLALLDTRLLIQDFLFSLFFVLLRFLENFDRLLLRLQDGFLGLFLRFTQYLFRLTFSRLQLFFGDILADEVPGDRPSAEKHDAKNKTGYFKHTKAPYETGSSVSL